MRVSATDVDEGENQRVSISNQGKLLQKILVSFSNVNNH